MEAIPRAKLSEDEWNRKNHVWKNADPITRGEGRDFNGIDNYQQYLDSLNVPYQGVVSRELDPNYVPDPNVKPIPVPRLNANEGIRNDGTVGGSMPRELRNYFSNSGGTPPNSNSPLFGVYKNWLNRQNQDWNPNEAENFGAYLQSFSNAGSNGQLIPKKQETQSIYDTIFQKLQNMTPDEQVAFARQMGVNI